MATRALSSPPRMLPLYARTVAPLLPGATLLPFLGARGGELPDLELTLAQLQVDPDHLAAYAHVCGFSLRDQLPATYPHVLAFPLHLALMTDRSFPFAAVGLVHVANRIVQHRPLQLGEPLDLRVFTTPLQAHPRGRTFALVSEARVGDELVWEDHSTMLRRGAKGSSEQDTGGEEPVPRTPARSPMRPAAMPARTRQRPARTPTRPARRPHAGRLAPARRPRPALRRRLGRPQPDPHARPQRQSLRLPARDRARDVDARPAASPRSSSVCRSDSA